MQIEQVWIVKFGNTAESAEVRAQSVGVCAAVVNDLRSRLPGPHEFAGAVRVTHRSLGGAGHWVARSAAADLSPDSGVWSRCFVVGPTVWASFGRCPEALLQAAEAAVEASSQPQSGVLPTLEAAVDSELLRAAQRRQSEAFASRGIRGDVAHDLRHFPQSTSTAMVDFGGQEDWEHHPSETLGVLCPELLDQLELLDDTVFDAIAGRPQACDALRRLWPAMLRELPRRLADESQAAYAEHAMNVWRQCVEGDRLRNPQLATTATEVLEILLTCRG